jgi:hypothetical protein
MRSRALALVALIAVGAPCAGCFVVPKKSVTENVISTGVTRVKPGTAAALAVEVDARGAMIRARASAPRLCTQERYAIVDVTVGREAALEVTPGGSGWELVASIITVPVSALITGIIVAATGDVTTRERKTLGVARRPCPVFGAKLPVTMVLPSGANVELVTDDYGGAWLNLPASEPAYGLVGVRVGDLPPRSIAYYRDDAACRVARGELYTRAGQATSAAERAALLDGVPVCGAANEVEQNRELAWRETIRAARAAAYGCALAIEVDAKVRALDVAHHAAVFRADPLIATCFAHDAFSRDRAAARFTTCRQARSEAMLRAQRITDLKQRTRALLDLPKCEAPGESR